MDEMPTSSDVALWRNYKDEETYGVGIIGGAVSGNLEGIDFDNHLGNAQQAFEEFTNFEDVARILENYTCPIETTKSGGYHIYYRSEKIDGSRKLAYEWYEIPDPEKCFSLEGQKNELYHFNGKDEQVRTRNGKKCLQFALIETKADGGLLVCAPTKGYTLIQGDLTQIPTIPPKDRDILIGYARSFDIPAEIITPAPRVSSHDKINDDERPGDIYNDRCIEEAKRLLKQHGWTQLTSKNWRRPGKSDGSPSATFGYVAENVFFNYSENAHPFTDSPAKSGNGYVYKPFDILTRLEFNGDYAAAAKAVAEKFNMPKRKQDKPIPKVVEVPAVAGKDTRNFWYMGDRGSFYIDHYSLAEFLESYGFFRYESVPLEYIFVRVINNVVEEVCFDQIRDFVLKHVIDNIDDKDIYNKINDSDKFKKSKLTMKVIEIKWLKDDIKTGWLYYRNTALKVTSNGCELVPFAKMAGMIWKSQILDRDFKQLSDEEVEKADSYRFANIVSNGKDDRMAAYVSALGYLMHGYRNPTECPMIGFLDETTSTEPAGGSGKTLGIMMVSKIKKTVWIDGKSLDLKSGFPWQRVSHDTQVVAIDDLAEGFPVVQMFSILTTGLPVNKKGVTELYIPFKDIPSFAFSSNYPPKAENSCSFDRRLFEIEIHKHFGSKHNIIDEFGRLPFEGWEDAEWFRFDNFMVLCLKQFLLGKLIRPQYVTLKLNKLRAQVGIEFIEWAEEAITVDNRYIKSTLYQSFKAHLQAENEAAARWMAANKFTIMLKNYADYNGWLFNPKCGSAGKLCEFSSGVNAVIVEDDGRAF